MPWLESNQIRGVNEETERERESYLCMFLNMRKVFRRRTSWKNLWLHELMTHRMASLRKEGSSVGKDKQHVKQGCYLIEASTHEVLRMELTPCREIKIQVGSPIFISTIAYSSGGLRDIQLIANHENETFCRHSYHETHISFASE